MHENKFHISDFVDIFNSLLQPFSNLYLHVLIIRIVICVQQLKFHCISLISCILCQYLLVPTISAHHMDIVIT